MVFIFFFKTVAVLVLGVECAGRNMAFADVGRGL